MDNKLYKKYDNEILDIIESIQNLNRFTEDLINKKIFKCILSNGDYDDYIEYDLYFYADSYLETKQKLINYIEKNFDDIQGNIGEINYMFFEGKVENVLIKDSEKYIKFLEEYNQLKYKSIQGEPNCKIYNITKEINI